MRDEEIFGTKTSSPYAGEYSIGPVPKQCEIRGIVKRIQNGNEIKRGTHIVDSCFYLEVDFYRVDKESFQKFVGTAKVYIPTASMGLRDFTQSVFFYPSQKIEEKTKYFQTAKKDLKDLFHKRVGIIGKMKDDPQDNHTHFMNHVKKVVIFMTADELDGKKGKKK